MSMESVGSFEAKTHLPRLLERVARGEEFLIITHGKPVARPVPAVPARSEPDVRRVIDELTAFRNGNTLGEGGAIRDLIEEGRRS
jgi:antitoxin (DNA-binding transcriptional repressor) of toxin-antitoxin stability system